MEPQAVYNYLIEQGYDPLEAQDLAHELSAPTGYNDLPIGSYAGEALGGGAAALGYKYSGAEGYMRNRFASKKPPLPPNASLRGMRTFMRAPLPGVAKLGVIGAGALAGSLAGEAVTGEDFWDSATSSESLGSVGGSFAGAALGERYGSKLAASALAKKAAAKAAGTGLARFASGRAGAMLGGRLGALGGSIIPGAGTAVGTGVGTVLGAIGGALAGRYLDNSTPASDAVDRMAGLRHQNLSAGVALPRDYKHAPQMKKEPDDEEDRYQDLSAGIALPRGSYEDLL